MSAPLTEHGSAKFQEIEGRPTSDINTGHALLWLGHPVAGWAKNTPLRARPDRVIAASADRHMLTIAPTRAGKGTSAIIPNLLTYPGSVFVIDPKGENAWVTAERRRRMGQEVYILDPWNEITKRHGPESNARFNPMAGLDPDSPDFTDDIAGLADALIINQGKDPHWDDSARELVAGLMAFLVEDPSTRAEASLGQTRRLLTLPREQLVALINRAVKRGGVSARKLSRFSQDTNEIASVISTAITQTAFLDNTALIEAMSASDFDFGRLASGKVSVYLVLPADKLGPYGRWLRLLVTIAIRAIARASRPSSKVLFLLDEFGTIGSLAAVEQAFGLMGGMGICLWPFVQDLNQLKRDYPDSWETFIANAEAVQAFHIRDNFSSDYLSRLLGVTTQEIISKHTETQRMLPLVGNPQYRGMEDRTFQRSLMFADEIRAMREDWQLIFLRGCPTQGALMHYYASPAFNGLYRPLPGFVATDAPELPERRKRKLLGKLVRLIRIGMLALLFLAGTTAAVNQYRMSLRKLSANDAAMIEARVTTMVRNHFSGKHLLKLREYHRLDLPQGPLTASVYFTKPLYPELAPNCLDVLVRWHKRLESPPDGSGMWQPDSVLICENDSR